MTQGCTGAVHGAVCSSLFLASVSDPTIENCFILPGLIELANYEESKKREEGETCPFRCHWISTHFGVFQPLFYCIHQLDNLGENSL